jgi:hypothetical protein
MRSAAEFEKRYASIPVRLAMKGRSGSGVLSLAGRDTKVTLSSPEYVRERDPHTGWFDLVFEQNDGGKILLHNALTNSTGMPHGERREWEYRIFPNLVVLDAEQILPSGKVRSISFTAEGLEEIFYYELAEWQPLHGAPAGTLKALRDLRAIEKDYPRDYEYFSPRDVYLLHRLPRVMRERVGDRVYEICLGLSERHHHNAVTLAPHAVATLRFRRSVPLDTALDAVWAWRRFFQQLAMKPLPFGEMSCRGSRRAQQRSSSLYFPSMEQDAPTGSRHPIEFRASHVPYGQWKHRRKFAEAMRRWIEADERRRLFRVRVDRVLEQMRNETSSRLVMDLCAAIESLTELKGRSATSDEAVAMIADAAIAAGAKTKPAVPEERIRGILGLLQHQSLSQRMKLLAAEAEPEVTKGNAREIIRLARDLRNFEAHGSYWDEMTLPLVAPTLDALASLCVLWDLKTSGFAAAFDDRELLAARRADWAARELKVRLSPTRRKQERVRGSAAG